MNVHVCMDMCTHMCAFMCSQKPEDRRRQGFVFSPTALVTECSALVSYEWHKANRHSKMNECANSMNECIPEILSIFAILSFCWV
jgi:hypothetical protein